MEDELYLSQFIEAIIPYRYLLRKKRNIARQNAYYIIMKSCTYTLMVPYCSKLLCYEYTHNFHYNNIVHLNSKKTGKKRRRLEKIFTENGT